MNPFFAYLNRLKHIRRWGLMRNTVPENDMEHSMQCAMIAHGLAALARERHGRDVNPETVLSLALYHDAGEVITGVKLADGSARFFHQGQALPAVDDRALSDAFFAIWLDPRTREPALRAKLLAEAGQAR